MPLAAWCIIALLVPALHALDRIDASLPALPATAEGIRTIALTFDDGPVPEATPVLLDALAQHGWKATFCLLGSRAEANPDLVRRMVSDGHELANHSWSHAKFTDLSEADLDAELSRTQDIISSLTGSAPRWMRPPYLATSPAIEQRIAAQQLGVLMETWNSWDWKRLPAGAVTERMLSGIPSGAVVLAHESFPQSVAEMPAIIAQLHAQGYRSVTVSRLVELLPASPAP